MWLFFSDDRGRAVVVNYSDVLIRSMQFLLSSSHALLSAQAPPQRAACLSFDSSLIITWWSCEVTIRNPFYLTITCSEFISAAVVADAAAARGLSVLMLIARLTFWGQECLDPNSSLMQGGPTFALRIKENIISFFRKGPKSVQWFWTWRLSHT